jgi:hypothetical protein
LQGLRKSQNGTNINAGILTLMDKLINICFLQGLYSDRAQTIVRSKNHNSFDKIAVTVIEEESAIASKNEKHRGPSMSSEISKCSNCNNSGHVASICYLKSKRDISVHQFSVRDGIQGSSRDVICFNCRKRAHS